MLYNFLKLNKGSHDHDVVWISDLNKHILILHSLLVSIEKIYPTLKERVYQPQIKHLDICKKYCSVHRTCIFNSLVGVWNSGQTLSFVFV